MQAGAGFSPPLQNQLFYNYATNTRRNLFKLGDFYRMIVFKYSFCLNHLNYYIKRRLTSLKFSDIIRKKSFIFSYIFIVR